VNATKFLIIASDYRPEPGGRVDYIDNLARGLLSIGQPTKVLAVVQSHKKERLAFLQNYEEWVIPFPVVHDKRPRNPVANKCVSVLEVVRCLSPRARHALERISIFPGSADAVARLKQVLDTEAPAMVVFGHLDARLYPFALCLLERKLPYGIIAHGLDFPRHATRINDIVRRGSVLRGAKWIAANSHYTKSLVEEWGIPSQRVKIVYPPIADEAIRRSANLDSVYRDGDQLNLATLCRVVKGKGVDIVLRALTVLAEKGVPFRYVIGGDGAERGALEALVSELGLRGSVHFAGNVGGDEKWRLLQQSDVYVMPSRPEPEWVESFGIAFIEAAAFGLPAVATNVAGIPEAVLDGQTGLLVSQESPGELAEALIYLYRNPERRKAMGRAGRERARREFSPATVAAHFQEQISNVA
jgi:phosphatidyl-myo-inositol dimannoside synthase